MKWNDCKMILFNRPYITGKEISHIEANMLGGELAGDGPYSKKCLSLMKDRFGDKTIFLMPSCTHALELSALALGIKEGDEVIMPTYTFVSTANAFALRGAKPVFVDIREDTLNIDEERIEERITSKTKAIVPVHYAGVGCAMDRIMEIAKKHNISVVEDAAQGFNSKFNSRYLGTMGALGCFSFHNTKNYSCGEGGAIVINDKVLVEKIEILREKGTNRSRFLRGEEGIVDKYTWVDIGSSFLLSDILASFLYAQLEEMDNIKELRRKKYDFYYAHLNEMGHLFKLPSIPEKCESNYHLFYLKTRSIEERRNLMKHLKEKGIQTALHYEPLHLSPVGKRYGYKQGDFSVAEKLSSTILRLPLYPNLTEGEQKYIVGSIKEFFN